MSRLIATHLDELDLRHMVTDPTNGIPLVDVTRYFQDHSIPDVGVPLSQIAAYHVSELSVGGHTLLITPNIIYILELDPVNGYVVRCRCCELSHITGLMKNSATTMVVEMEHEDIPLESAYCITEIINILGRATHKSISNNRYRLGHPDENPTEPFADGDDGEAESFASPHHVGFARNELLYPLMTLSDVAHRYELAEAHRKMGYLLHELHLEGHSGSVDELIDILHEKFQDMPELHTED